MGLRTDARGEDGEEDREEDNMSDLRGKRAESKVPGSTTHDARRTTQDEGRRMLRSDVRV